MDEQQQDRLALAGFTFGLGLAFIACGAVSAGMVPGALTAAMLVLGAIALAWCGALARSLPRQ